MEITFRFRIDDPRNGISRRFKLSESLPLPHAPRIGEGVVIPTNNLNYTLGARRVEDVIYAPDGSVILDLLLDGFTNDVEAQVAALVSAGFTEIDDSQR